MAGNIIRISFDTEDGRTFTFEELDDESTHATAQVAWDGPVTLQIHAIANNTRVEVTPAVLDEEEKQKDRFRYQL